MVKEAASLREVVKAMAESTSSEDNSTNEETTEKEEASKTSSSGARHRDSRSSTPELVFVSEEKPAVYTVRPRKPEKRRREEVSISGRDQPIEIIDSSDSSS